MQTELKPGAEKVIVSYNKPNKQCKKIATLMATQRGKMLTAKQLEKGAMDQIRNSAYEHKADYVYILKDYAHSTRDEYIPSAVYAVTMKGMAYQCN